MKLHPDIMPAFSIMIADFLYSPQNWEPVRRLVELLASKLNQDESLRDKHCQYLDQLEWESTLGTQTQPFVPANLHPAGWCP